MVADRRTTPLLAPRARALTPEQWMNRCVELAEEKHLIGSAQMMQPTDEQPATIDLFSVRSVSSGSIYHGRHIVTRDLVSGTISCDCTAAGYGLPCSHIGSVLVVVRRRAELITQVETARATWERENLGGSLLDVYRGWEA